MKIVINVYRGGLNLSDEARAVVHTNDIRTDSALINFIEEHGSEAASSCCTSLKVVEIPDDATDYNIVTDYSIDEYDGFESIIYVLDGKLYRQYQRERKPFTLLNKNLLSKLRGIKENGIQ